jgi:hypothetical protein
MSEVFPLLLLCGLDAHEQKRFAQLTAATVSGVVQLVVITENEVDLTLGQAWMLPHRYNWGASSSLPGAVICSHVSGAEISRLMDACRASDFPRIIWAIGREKVASRRLKDYLKELTAERGEFRRAVSWAQKKAAQDEPPV